MSAVAVLAKYVREQKNNLRSFAEAVYSFGTSSDKINMVAALVEYYVEYIVSGT